MILSFKAFAETDQKDRVFRFLNGLNESFNNVRSHILLMKYFLSLDEAYSIVIREESQRILQLHATPIAESSALAVMGEQRKKGKEELNLGPV